MKGLFLIGGCNFSNKENKNIHLKMLEMSKKARPSLLYIPVSDKSYIPFLNTFKDFNCDVTIYNESLDLDDFDIIYIGGGNTEEMIKRFNKNCLTQKLINHLDDKIIAGVSAGAIFWFKKYYSDTYSYQSNFTIYNYKMLDGINYFDALVSPHFDEEGKEYFSDYIGNDLAIGLENNTALILTNEVSFMIDRPHGAIYYYIDGVMNLLTNENKDVLKKYLIK